MADLRVELYGELVGHLVGTDRRTFDFVTDHNAIETFGLGSTVLSESVPFELVANRSRAGRRRIVFAELLPEGTARRICWLGGPPVSGNHWLSKRAVNPNALSQTFY